MLLAKAPERRRFDWAMPESGFLVTSHSYDTSRPLEKGRAEGAG